MTNRVSKSHDKPNAAQGGMKPKAGRTGKAQVTRQAKRGARQYEANRQTRLQSASAHFASARSSNAIRYVLSRQRRGFQARAMHSISTSPPMGSAATCTQLRAG